MVDEPNERSTINHQLIANLRTWNLRTCERSNIQTFKQLDYDHDYELRLR